MKVLLCLNAVAFLRTSPVCNLPRHVVHVHLVVTHDGWPGLNCSTDLGGTSRSNNSKCHSPRQTLQLPSWLWLSTDNSHMLYALRKVCMTSPPEVYPTHSTPTSHGPTRVQGRVPCQKAHFWYPKK